MKNQVLVLVCLLLSIAGLSTAEIISVPLEFDTIQDAIRDNGTGNGDTIIVEHGLYIEQINFLGKRILVGSRYAITPQEAHIQNTIINANWGGCCVSFVSNETAESRLVGFTITHGRSAGPDNIGAINISNASPTIRDCYVFDNRANGNGGGLYASGSNTVLENMRFVSNVSSNDQGTADGGAIYITGNSNMTMRNCTLISNRADDEGGGIWVGGSALLTVSRSLIVRNQSAKGPAVYANSSNNNNTTFTNITARNNALGNNQSGIFHNQNGRFVFLNSIVWNGGRGFMGADDITIGYCDVENGENAVLHNGNLKHWEDGNISNDPRMTDPVNDDYTLRNNSPCIDAGDPNAGRDPDGTVSDMGRYYVHQSGTVWGVVLQASDRSPVQWVRVRPSYSEVPVTEADQNGVWVIDDAQLGNFSLTFSMDGYNDQVLEELTLEPNQELQVDTVYMTAPAFELSMEGITLQLNPDSSRSIGFTLTNSGDGPLDWRVRKELLGDFAVEPWIMRENLFVGDTVSDSRLSSAVLANDKYYVTGAGPASLEDTTRGYLNYVYVFNRDGVLERFFEQPGQRDRSARYGFEDITWDGNLLWAVEQDSIFGFNTDGEFQTGFLGYRNSLEAVAWDADRQVFWACASTSPTIVGHTDQGDQVFTITQRGLRITGLAYYPEDADGYQLYAHCEISASMYIYKYNIETNDTMFVTQLINPIGGRPEGIEIVSDYDNIGSWTLIATANDGSHDRIDVWHIKSYDGWMLLEPVNSGTMNPQTTQDFTLTLNTRGPNGRFTLPDDVYEGQFRWTHNAMVGEFIMPIQMDVHFESVGDNNEAIPSDFNITSAYPNPFNSTTTVAYTMPINGRVLVNLYDLQGRLVKQLHDDMVPAGHQRIVIGSNDLASGIYVVRMQGAGVTQAKKLVLMK